MGRLILLFLKVNFKTELTCTGISPLRFYAAKEYLCNFAMLHDTF